MMLENNFEKLKTYLKLRKLKWEEEMNKLTLIELIKLIQGMEMEYKVIWEEEEECKMRKVMIEKDTYKFYCKFSCKFSCKFYCKFSCKFYCKFYLIQRHGMPIYRIQYGVKSIQVDDKDWVLCLIIVANNLELLLLRVELGVEPRQRWNSAE